MRTTVEAIITFGAISAPVGVASAGTRRNVELTTIHICGSKMTQRYQCPVCNTLAEPETTLKGYKVAKDSYVAIDVEAYQAITEQRSRSLVIEKFIAEEDVLPEMIEKHYFLTPSDHPALARPYELLLSALVADRAAGFGRCRLWGKEYPFVIKASPVGLLQLGTLFLADEMPPPGDELSKLVGDIDAAEIALMSKFMALRSGQLEAGDLRSSTREAKREFIDNVIAGTETPRPDRVVEPEVGPVNLMERLKEMVS